ncbi:MAG: monofunctional biosynthetic peptidoglycan transglycosylase [Nitrospinaceae bacterium]|nr:MAG: monofunctional biosynthetic peptidoglycan transglycosylase [Nitrospinaceae bacterium]
MSLVPKLPKRSGKKKVFRIRLGKILFDLFLAFLTLTLVPVLIYSAANPQTTPLLWIRWLENDQNEQYTRVIKRWVPLERISPHLIKAVITAEDQKFFQHRGFDWQAIESAIKVNLTSNRTLGASTISMQTSRNVFLWQGRNLFRKGLESYFTVLVENLWSKKRILEVYLNVIEWGKGVYGCDAASQHYFNHSCATLSPVEAAWLAAILPNPRSWSIHRPQRHVEKRQARILNSMVKVRLPRLS